MKFIKLVCAALIACMVYGSGEAAAQPYTTVIAHGFTTGSKGSWVQAMAQAILARGGFGGSIYRYEGSTGVWTYVPVPEADGTSDNIVLIFNWVPESASPSPGPNWNYAQAAGDVLYAMLRSPQYAGQNGPADLVMNRTVHFIGHSRGACVNSEAVLRFALAGIPIDQYTGLDPHPVDGTLDSRYNYDWNDPTPAKWNNLTWADVYWRADGGGIINGLDFDGIPIANMFNTMLNESALNCCAYGFAHLDVHLWYHGTIDLSAAPCDGEQCINATMRNTWWPPGPPTGYTQRGYYYAALGGGIAMRPATPAGVPPIATDSIVNGNFDQGSYAGWGYHGGLVNGQILVQGGVSALILGAGIGNSGGNATHNRFFLPANASAIALDYRVLTAAAGESLRIILHDVGANTDHVLGSFNLTPAGDWITSQMLPLGCAVPRGKLYTLTLQIISGGAITSVVGIDNLRYTTAMLVGDATGDGMVNVADLLAVIAQWGPCPPSPQTCPADVAPPLGDGQVNVGDLLAVIAGWGQCP